MTYIFESGLAHHIEGLIQQKRADGYAYNSEDIRINATNKIRLRKEKSDD